jgi:16S rRNA (guanine527-N7)-methyltransferase
MNRPAGDIASRVSHVIQASGLCVNAAAADACSCWIELVREWNKKVDLTAARGEDELVDLMLADALLLACHLPAAARVIDVGTGAGAPGLPLSIVRSDLEVTLSEPLQKRVAFLRNAVGTIWGSNERGSLSSHRPPRIVRERGEELARRRQSFDVAISRATLPPPGWLALGTELAGEGEVWLLLARDEPPVRAGWAVRDDLRYRWPFTGADRRAVRFVPQRDPQGSSGRLQDVVRTGDGD